MRAKGSFRLSDVFSALYTVIMVPFLLLLLLLDLMSLLTIPTILTSGFGNTSNATVLWPCVFTISLSFLIPGLRRMYYRLPWLEPLVVMLVTDSVLVVLFYEIFNFGYQDTSPARHLAFTALSLVWLVGGRLLQCWWFKRRPIAFVGREMLS